MVMATVVITHAHRQAVEHAPAGGEAKTAGRRINRRIIDFQDAADRLLFHPFRNNVFRFLFFVEYNRAIILLSTPAGKVRVIYLQKV